MKKLNFLLFAIFLTYYSCDSLLQEKDTSKDQIIEKLTDIEKEIDEKILEMKEQAELSDGQILKDIEKSIKELSQEKKKVKRSIKKTISAGEKEIEQLKKEAQKLENEVKTAQKKLSDKLKQLKNKK